MDVIIWPGIDGHLIRSKGCVIYPRNTLIKITKELFTGSGVGMLAFGSPMLAHAIVPPLITISGFAPKKDGFQITRSANFPNCGK